MTVVSFFLAKPILMLIDTPEKILATSVSYLKIVFLGMIFTYLYNFFSNTLRSIGDSRTPLLFLIVSSLLNISLDIVFVMVIGLGVSGAAIAPVLSQAVSSILCIVFINRSIPLFIFPKKSLCWTKDA
jgi:Na+-driven multidrug efflux pump